MSIALGIYNFGTRISSWRGGCDDFICRCCAPFYHFDGIYWQFYWLFFVIYLALHFPLKTEKAHHELDGYDVRYFHHIFGHYFWLARHVLFGQSSKKSFCSGCSSVNQPKLLFRRSHLQFQRRIQQENCRQKSQSLMSGSCHIRHVEIVVELGIFVFF